MPRKERHAKARIDTPLVPMMHFWLMVGHSAPARITGWVEVALIPPVELAAAFAVAWAEHGDVLIAEAAAFGFTPWGQRHRRPKGAGVERWKTSFIAQHQY